MRNLLITGVPGVGKTTIIRRTIARLAGRSLRGFTTEEIRESGHRLGFRLETLDGHSTTLAHVDIRSPHRVSRYGVDLGRLDRVVETSLSLDHPVDLYLIDEIGKMECFSERFVRAAEALLDSERPVVATVALKGSGFIARVKERNDIDLWEATKGNRDDMPVRILSWLEEGRTAS